MPTDNKNCIEKFQDPMYASLFLHESWRELLEMAEPGKAEVSFFIGYILNFVKDWAAKSEKKGLSLQLSPMPSMVCGYFTKRQAFHNKNLKIVISVQIYQFFYLSSFSEL